MSKNAKTKNTGKSKELASEIEQLTESNKQLTQQLQEYKNKFIADTEALQKEFIELKTLCDKISIELPATKIIIKAIRDELDNRKSVG